MVTAQKRITSITEFHFFGFVAIRDSLHIEADFSLIYLVFYMVHISDAMLLVLEWHKNEKSCNISYLYEDILDTLVVSLPPLVQLLSNTFDSVIIVAA
jgi:hypothetical protein